MKAQKKVAPPDGIMQAMPSGFCSNGFCEGRKITVKVPEGKPTPRCKGRFTHKIGMHKVTYCPCDCHDEVTELYTMTGVERVWPASLYQTAQDQDKWDKERAQYVFASIQSKPVIVLPKNADVTAETVTVEEALGSASEDEGESVEGKPLIKLLIPPSPVVPIQERAIRGRPPGQLELEVKLICDAMILGVAATTDRELKPVTISRLIDANNPPSTGAVTNILRGWARIGFATIKEEPVRFVGYTNAGIELGIEPLREREKAMLGGQRRRSTLDKREDARSGGFVGAIERRKAKRKGK